jgi:hypothetical protein
MRRFLATTLLLVLAACRPDPGEPDYSGMERILRRESLPTGPLPGPSPYLPGTRRLSLGAFYDGGSSDALAPDGVTRHYFIFVVEGTSRLTYTQRATEDRLEGLVADELSFEGTPWWGGGLVWDTPTDLSAWKTLHVSLRSSDPGLAAIDLRMLHGAGSPKTVTLSAAAYGWKNDGVWHSLALPLSDFAKGGADLAKVRGPLVLGGVGAAAGETLLVDGLYVE